MRRPVCREPTASSPSTCRDSAPVPGQRTQEQVDVLSRTDHECRRHVGCVAGAGNPAAAMTPAAIDDAWRAKEHQQRQCMNNGEGRVGGHHLGQRQHERKKGSTKRAGPGHPEQIVDPGKSPELPRQPERQSRQQQGGRAGGRKPGRVRPIARRIRNHPRERHSQRRQGPVDCNVQSDSHIGTRCHAGPYNAGDQGVISRANPSATIAYRLPARFTRYSQLRRGAAGAVNVLRCSTITIPARGAQAAKGTLSHDR